jgi:hypothetical protein
MASKSRYEAVVAEFSAKRYAGGSLDKPTLPYSLPCPWASTCDPPILVESKSIKTT